MPTFEERRDRRRSQLSTQADHQHALERAAAADPPTDVSTRLEDPRWSAVQALVVSAIVTVSVLAALVGLLVLLRRTSNGPEAALPLVFVAAAVVLILVVCTLTIVLKRLRLTNAEEPMGLPRGSIRAVIALLLILLFFIASMFLFHSTLLGGERTENRTLRGIDVTRFAAIPTDQILTAAPRTAGTGTVYDVELYPSSTSTPTSDDLAKQLVTTLATLVTAVAAFYFGANSVGGALKDAVKAAPATDPGAGAGSPGPRQGSPRAGAGPGSPGPGSTSPGSTGPGGTSTGSTSTGSAGSTSTSSTAPTAPVPGAGSAGTGATPP